MKDRSMNRVPGIPVKFLTYTLFTWLGVLNQSGFGQGSLTPPGGPGPTMKTLQQVEPRTPVDVQNTPGNNAHQFIISQPGSYYLTDNVKVSDHENGISVEVPGVTLDLNGFEINRTIGSGGAGILIQEPRCHVYNGRILGNFTFGVDASLDSQMNIHDLVVQGVSSNGIMVLFESTVERCIVEGVGADGIHAEINSFIRHCSVRTAGRHGIVARENCLVEDNLLNNILEGDAIRIQERCIIRNNLVDYPHFSGGAGIHAIGANGGNRIENNNIQRRLTGIMLDSAGNYLADNLVQNLVATNYVFAADNQLNLLISEVPETLSWPCVARLAGSVQMSVATTGITIKSSDVTLDLGGHTITGSGSASGIYLPGTAATPYQRVTIRNGSIRQFSNGINAVGVENCLFEDLQLSDGGGNGISLWASAGMNVRGNVIRRCSVREFSGFGMQVVANDTGTFSQGNLVEDCAILSNESPGLRLIADMGGVMKGNTFRNCRIVDNLNFGINIAGLNGGSVTGNRIVGNHIEGTRGGGIGLTTLAITSGNLIVQNVAMNNTTHFVVGALDTLGPIVNTVGTLANTGDDAHPLANFGL